MPADLGSRLRDDHPRLFFNSDTLGDVLAYAKTEESHAFGKMRARMDELLDASVEVADHGKAASRAAFVYLATDDAQYRELSTALLQRSLEYYRQCYENEESVAWKSYSRICAWAAIDWLWNDLDPTRRENLAGDLLELTRIVQPTEERDSFSGENWSDTTAGFYGTPSLLWPAGVVAHDEGVDDALATEFLERGYELHTDLLEYRAALAGDDGGSASGALGYALVAYPWAEFNFFHTIQSATGENVAEDWPYVSRLAGYLFWNWLPGNREFGYGDVYKVDNQIQFERMDMHLSQIVHFYGDDRPEDVAFAKWLRERTPREFDGEELPIPFARFLVHDRSLEIDPRGPPADLPTARQFEHMGQTFFRSGYGSDDTYAMFVGGGEATSHKHYDENHFTIYKRGYLAMDSGTRPQPGTHHSHYNSRSVAHNTVLIHMPGEEMPDYWGSVAPGESDEPYPNDGGQRRKVGSDVTAFETDEEYSYVACDATAVYHEDKCDRALRQFVFVPPDTFVVYDRVRSTRPEYGKTWLLHTATEPTVEGSRFTTFHEGGRLFGQSILPQDAELSKVGGPGEQFRAGGQNWPIPDPADTHIDVSNENPMFGQWRLEASPDAERRTDHFLHLLRVNASESKDLPGPLYCPPKDPGEMAELIDMRHMVDVEYLERDGEVGLGFVEDGVRREVLFGTDGSPSGSIRIVDGETEVVDRSLTESVQPQSGPFG